MKSRSPKDARSHLMSRTEPVGECLKWLGSSVPGRNSKYGYGQCSFQGKSWLAHRLSFYLSTGINPGSLQVMHLCDFSLCINPKHLALGTGSDNMRDAARKRRMHGQQKTHCPHGHEYTKENTYFTSPKNGGLSRGCRICKRRRFHESKARKALGEIK